MIELDRLANDCPPAADRPWHVPDTDHAVRVLDTDYACALAEEETRRRHAFEGAGDCNALTDPTQCPRQAAGADRGHSDRVILAHGFLRGGADWLIERADREEAPAPATVDIRSAAKSMVADESTISTMSATAVATSPCWEKSLTATDHCPAPYAGQRVALLIQRAGTQLEAAHKKARIGMELAGLLLGLAGEGSFGSDPFAGILLR